MVHRIEERFQVAIDRMTALLLPSGFHVTHCLMGVATRAEPEAVSAEAAIIERGHDLGDGLLDHAADRRQTA